MGPIVIIEDDLEDQDIIRTIMDEMQLTNKVIFFDNGEDAFDYLSRKEIIPFLIFSDINMPGMNGFQLRDKIHEDPDMRVKCIPYLFLTTGGESKIVWEAYSRNAQGFFVKPPSMELWKKLMFKVIDYWGSSKKPL